MNNENLPSLGFWELTAEQRESVLKACVPGGTLTQREAVWLRYRVVPAREGQTEAIVPLYAESNAPRSDRGHSADAVLCLHRDDGTEGTGDITVAKSRRNTS